MKKINVVSLFAGAGGLDLGFKQAGFNIIASSEIDKYAVQTHNFNFKLNSPIIDITNKKHYDNFIKFAIKNKPKVLIGGFPCQGYSMAGHRKINDERNQLYKKVIDVLKKLKIHYFLLENVPGILSINNGKEIEKIEKYFNKHNFFFEKKVLNASYFGVPQIRKRVIFIGYKNKRDKNKAENVLQQLLKINKKIKNVKDAIKDLESAIENPHFNHIYTKHTIKILKKIKNTKIGESVYKTYSDGWRKIDYNKPSPTVKENHGGVHIHPKMNRALTPRELARLQTFPDKFIFKGPKSAQLVQIGNAVPALMAKEIAKVFKKEFFDNE